jgi:hypothetical protein
LWRLIERGQLRVVEHGSPISSSEAKVLISFELERALGSQGHERRTLDGHAPHETAGGRVKRASLFAGGVTA